MLSWRQTQHARLNVLEEASAAPRRVVVALLDPKNRLRLPESNALLERARDGSDRLFECRPAAVAVPRELRTKRCAPRLLNDPVHRKLTGHPPGTRLPGRIDDLRADVKIERRGQP